MIRPKTELLSNYFSVVKPKYIYLKLTPLKSLRNYNSDKIISAVTTIYRTLTQRIDKDNKKYFYTVQSKVGYYIFLEKDNVGFYFIIPEQYRTLIEDKINDTWKGITVEEVNSIPLCSNNCLKYGLKYHKEDAMSLSTDKRNNTLLSSLMSTLEVMEGDDMIGVLFNFIPTSQLGWRAQYDDIIEKLKNGYPIEKERNSVTYIFKLLYKLISFVFDTVVNSFGEFIGENLIQDDHYYEEIQFLPETKRKRNSRIISTQAAIFSQSKDKKRELNNVISACESFKSLTGDNELDYRKITAKNIDIVKPKLKGFDIMKTTANECQNFLSLPARELIEQHNIECIDVFETKVPKPLQSGTVCVGNSTYKGSSSNVYLTSDSELSNLALAIIGANRSGKSTYISNFINDCLTNNECVILLDYCGNCELSEYIKGLFPSRTLEIDCSDIDNLQGMGYNEIKPESNVFKQYRNAKMQATQLIAMINCVNEDDKVLKAKMDRYLEAASLIVFIGNGSIKDVFNVLLSYKSRDNWIKKVPQNQMENMQEYIQSLRELDEVKEGKTIGTKFNNIVGIIDRLNTLKKNTYIELCLKKDCKNNINLLDEIQKNQIICIKMPEAMFTTATEKDIYATYWFTKIWLALQLRKNEIKKKDHTKVNIIIDELYQVERCQDLISNKLSQIPKFTAKVIVSCHYLDQIPILKKELKASNASYMLLQGSNISNFNNLKTEFTNLGYAPDDLLNLKRFHSLNLVSYENGYWAGVTALPKPKQKFVS